MSCMKQSLLRHLMRLILQQRAWVLLAHWPMLQACISHVCSHLCFFYPLRPERQAQG